MPAARIRYMIETPKDGKGIILYVNMNDVKTAAATTRMINPGNTPQKNKQKLNLLDYLKERLVQEWDAPKDEIAKIIIPTKSPYKYADRNGKPISVIERVNGFLADFNKFSHIDFDFHENKKRNKEVLQQVNTIEELRTNATPKPKSNFFPSGFPPKLLSIRKRIKNDPPKEDQIKQKKKKPSSKG